MLSSAMFFLVRVDFFAIACDDASCDKNIIHSNPVKGGVYDDDVYIQSIASGRDVLETQSYGEDY